MVFPLKKYYIRQGKAGNQRACPILIHNWGSLTFCFVHQNCFTHAAVQPSEVWNGQETFPSVTHHRLFHLEMGWLSGPYCVYTQPTSLVLWRTPNNTTLRILSSQSTPYLASSFQTAELWSIDKPVHILCVSYILYMQRDLLQGIGSHR